MFVRFTAEFFQHAFSFLSLVRLSAAHSCAEWILLQQFCLSCAGFMLKRLNLSSGSRCCMVSQGLEFSGAKAFD